MCCKALKQEASAMILFSFCLCGLLWLLPQLSTVSNAQSLCPDVTECYCFTSGYDIRADCIGEDITVVSTDLPWNMTQLYISYSSMGTLLSGNLSMYEELTLVELVENHLLTTIQTGAFNGLDFITSLVILHNAIESIPLDTLPKMLQTIYLQNNELNAMPPLNGLTEVQLINLDYNKIIEIEGNAFSTNSKLEEIYLSNNNIQSIATGAFNNLNNLRTLYLNGNQIPSIEVGDFNGLSQLQTLSFMDNKLTELINGAFNGIGTTTLTELNLSSNQITSIEGDVFSSFSSLKALHLVNNRLTTVPSEAIKGPTMLQFLDLSFNRLETIEDNSFAGMNNLDTLNIGEMNSLLTISENAFVGMPKILIFTLHGNKNLTELNLGYLPDNEFQQLQQLRIYNNGFITLQEDTFATKASLQRVELFDNPFHCDCKLGWMPRVIEEDVVWAREWVGGNQILCQTPKHLEAFNIPTMKVKDFVCDLPAVEPSYSGGQDKVVAYLHGNATLKVWKFAFISIWHFNYLPTWGDIVIRFCFVYVFVCYQDYLKIYIYTDLRKKYSRRVLP